jgi:hypothetical protein
LAQSVEHTAKVQDYLNVAIYVKNKRKMKNDARSGNLLPTMNKDKVSRPIVGSHFDPGYQKLLK